MNIEFIHSEFVAGQLWNVFHAERGRPFTAFLSSFYQFYYGVLLLDFFLFLPLVYFPDFPLPRSAVLPPCFPSAFSPKVEDLCRFPHSLQFSSKFSHQ